MGKISPVSAKYIVHASIEIEGVVDSPDVIGAIFGQTEGLLGSELELRELQRNGKVGRIEVKLETKTGKTTGSIIIPSSLDKAETAIIAASLETIQRIGPCNAKVSAESIEDVRISKRTFVVDRAKELLRDLTDKVLPDSQELADEVAQSVRMMAIVEYGKDRLAAGSAIEESDEIIVVEGRADVLNLLKHGIKNAIAMNGTSIPETIKELSRKKEVTLFVDGDRGGDLIIKEAMDSIEVDFIVKAPDGKEVEEITKKEIYKALRGKLTLEQAKMELAARENHKPRYERYKQDTRESRDIRERYPPKQISTKDTQTFKEKLDDLVGTRGAYLLDENTKVLGKVPTSELITTINNLKTGIFAVVFDGIINNDLLRTAEQANIKYIVGMDSTIQNPRSRVNLITKRSL